MKSLLMILGFLLIIMPGCGKEPEGTAPSDATMTISATPSEIDVNGDISVITVIVTRPSGLPVDDGTLIIFTTTLGGIELEAVTTNGVATNHLISGQDVGTATVTAQTTRGVETQTVSIDVAIVNKSSYPDATVTVSANPVQIEPQNEFFPEGDTSTITALISPSDGRNVDDGTMIFFSTSLGTIAPEAPTLGGVATNYLQSGPQPGTATVKAVTRGGAQGTVNVTIQDTFSASLIIVTANPSEVPRGGTSTITATLYNQFGDFVQGAPVQFSTTTGGSMASAGAILISNAFGQVTDILSVNQSTSVSSITVTAQSQLQTGSVIVTVTQ